MMQPLQVDYQLKFASARELHKDLETLLLDGLGEQYVQGPVSLLDAAQTNRVPGH